MRIKKVFVIAISVTLFGVAGTAQGQKAPRTPPASPAAAAAGDSKSVIFNWMWYTGMLRSVQEVDSVATLELQGMGTTRVGGEPCKITSYRESINYQVSGMRVQYACTTPNGQAHRRIEVVSGQFAWDEDMVGAELEAGRGKATPNTAALNERLIRLWAGPQGAPKAALAAGANTKVAMEGGKPTVTFPIPGVQGAIAKATLSAENQAERVEVRQGNVVTEFTYTNYADYNSEDDKVFGYLPGHMVEKKDGVTIVDLMTKVTDVGNLYIVVPVPDSVRKSLAAQP